MKSSPISKKTIITIIVILALVLVYFYFMGGEAPGSNSLLAGVEVSGIGAAELSLLSQMKSLRIDTSLFKDPAYISLVDYSVDIRSENVGRSNPFAPVPGVPNPFVTESQTNQTPATGR